MRLIRFIEFASLEIMSCAMHYPHTNTTCAIIHSELPIGETRICDFPLSPYRGKLMDLYGSTTARHRFFLFVLGPILYVAFVSVSTYVRCTRRLISKKIFFCSRRWLQYLIKIHDKQNLQNLARSFLSYPCTINN